MNIKNKNKAYTLVEIMIGILIVSFVMIGGFQALTAVTIGKAKLIQQTDIQKDSLYFTQKLFEMIKKGGTIDYEEYFNRKVIGNTTYSSGHFLRDSGFGNFGRNGVVGSTAYGDNFYYCRSNSGDEMTGRGCFDNDKNSYSSDVLFENQRYGQYSFQFIDYNSNFDADNGLPGDEDGDSNILGDDDDEYLGDGPEVFTGGVDLTELYLISGNRLDRTLFRWNVDTDPDSPYPCSLDNSNTITLSGCLGTVEYLKLDGKDWGMSHDLSVNDSTKFDGTIDTWVINEEFTGINGIVAGSGAVNWVSLFPKSINVSEFRVHAYPNKDIGYAWKNTNSDANISPYVELIVKLKPSWKSRRLIKGEGKELDFSMTISLSDIYSN